VEYTTCPEEYTDVLVTCISQFIAVSYEN